MTELHCIFGENKMKLESSKNRSMSNEKKKKKLEK